MFYLGGTFGVPRRFAAYNGLPIDSLAAFSTRAAVIASGFAVLLILGLLLVFGVVYAALAVSSRVGKPASEPLVLLLYGWAVSWLYRLRGKPL